MAGETTAITGLVAWIALTLPFAALLTAILLAMRRRSGPGEPQRRAPVTGRYGAPVAPGPDRTGRAAPVSGRTPAPAGRPAPSPRDAGEGELRRLLALAEHRDDQPAIAELSLALARCLQMSGEERAAGDCLRRTVRIARSLDDKRLHAEARLKLGDQAAASGDLTTACEHWQMARALFSELGETAKVAVADTHMRNHGCPTDWVLNDF